MSENQPLRTGIIIMSEMREFAGFTAREQRYIRRSLEIAKKTDKVFFHWARDLEEDISIQEQMEAYAVVPTLRKIMPQEYGSDMIEPFMGPLIKLTVSDLKQDHIDCFSAYRFLYERLLGALVRPWLPSTFCAAAAVPELKPNRRKKLLQSISEAAATSPGWTTREPIFIPKWVDKVEQSA